MKTITPLLAVYGTLRKAIRGRVYGQDDLSRSEYVGTTKLPGIIKIVAQWGYTNVPRLIEREGSEVIAEVYKPDPHELGDLVRGELLSGYELKLVETSLGWVIAFYSNRTPDSDRETTDYVKYLGNKSV